MMALDGLHLDPRHFDGDPPGRRAHLCRRDPLGHEVRLHFAAADDRRFGAPRDRFRIAQVIDRRMGDDDEVHALQVCSTSPGCPDSRPGTGP